MGITDPTKLIDTIGKHADALTESGEERQQALSDRHTVDMTSDSWLSKNIRPLTLIFLMVCQLVIIVAELFQRQVSDAIIIQVGTLLGGAFSFYFYSKKTERVAQKNAEATIKMKEMELKHEIQLERKQRRLERKKERKTN